MSKAVFKKSRNSSDLVQYLVQLLLYRPFLSSVPGGIFVCGISRALQCYFYGRKGFKCQLPTDDRSSVPGADSLGALGQCIVVYVGIKRYLMGIRPLYMGIKSGLIPNGVHCIILVWNILLLKNYIVIQSINCSV